MEKQASIFQEIKMLESIGTPDADIPVELSTKFLDHFSEQLYSSPQKAFEELISNSWDAGANYVDIRIPNELHAPDATMTVLDNGASMDLEGLKNLWKIASSPKANERFQHGRQVIGKFGIGKLATYVLANNLTYICRASDGIIRKVTMDYSSVDADDGKMEDRLISDIHLQVHQISDEQLMYILKHVIMGEIIEDLINNDVPKPTEPAFEDEFYYHGPKYIAPKIKCWTLVILSNLKPTGKELKTGILKRMLEAALPFGSDITIHLNGQSLYSSKTEYPVSTEWMIGKDLNIDSFEIDEDSLSSCNYEEDDDTLKQDDTEDSSSDSKRKMAVKVNSYSEPYPHITIDGLGKITGRVRIFRDKVSGGKSDDRGFSNGFHVNVLGRVVNQRDNAFGENNLSHAVWSRFRMAVRADGLDNFLTTNREQFKECKEIKIFRSFLRKVFNQARIAYDSDANAALGDGGDALVKSLGVISLHPLRNLVAETLKKKTPMPGLFDETDLKDREEHLKRWNEDTGENINTALKQVKLGKTQTDALAMYRLADNSIVINKEHPFVLEHGRTRSGKEIVQTLAMINLLTDMYAIEIGIDIPLLTNIRDYREKLMRYKAIEKRESGIYIAKLLQEAQNDKDYRKLELVVADALRYIGYEVKKLGKSGEPEGIAKAYTYPTASPTPEDYSPPLYSFSYDAKSSKHDKVQTNNINLSGVSYHRDKFNANYALVIAPGYRDGSISSQCAAARVTPITASDLGKLLSYTIKYGAISLIKLQELFKLYDWSEVSQWVSDLEGWLISQRKLSLDIFLAALELLKGQIPDALDASIISLICRQQLHAPYVLDTDVISLVRGLQIIIPDIVGFEGSKIIINTSANKLKEVVHSQLEKLEN